MARTSTGTGYREGVDMAGPNATPGQMHLNDLATQLLKAREQRLKDIGAPQGYHGRRMENEPGYVPTNRVGNYGGRSMFNLRGVMQVLEEEGYDPTVAVVKILKGEPDPDDPKGRRYLVEPEVRLRAAQELMKFVHPTRKAIEVEDVTPPRGEEIDRRMGELLGKYLALVGNGSMPGTLLEAAEDTIRELTGQDPFGEEPPFNPEDML